MVRAKNKRTAARRHNHTPLYKALLLLSYLIRRSKSKNRKKGAKSSTTTKIGAVGAPSIFSGVLSNESTPISKKKLHQLVLQGDEMRKQELKQLENKISEKEKKIEENKKQDVALKSRVDHLKQTANNITGYLLQGMAAASANNTANNSFVDDGSSSEQQVPLTPEQLEALPAASPIKKKKKGKKLSFKGLSKSNIIHSPSPKRKRHPSIYAPSPKQAGEGGVVVDTPKSGLYNSEVSKLLSKFRARGFLGTFSIDQIPAAIISKNRKQVSFILNIVPHNIQWGHFVSVFIDGARNTLEYFDPLGMEPVKGFKKAITPLLESMKLPSHPPFQLKINRIRNQALNSSNCGYFAMRFLIRRYKGESFRQASGYDEALSLHKSEAGIRRFKQHIKEFGTI